jgi:hypothetical protein
MGDEYNLDDVPDEKYELGEWLIAEGFINDPADMECKHCHSPVQLGYSSHYKKDGFCFRCTNNYCRRFYSARTGSFFEYSHISIRKTIQLLISFVDDVSAKSAARLFHVSRQTVSALFDWFRLYCQRNLEADPIVFDGADGDMVYEVDELVLKNVRNHVMIDRYWIGGILERSSGMVHFHPLQARDRESIIPPIQDMVPAGAFIFSDELKVYNVLNAEENAYMHYSVNHSRDEYTRIEQLPEGGHITVSINALEGMNRVVRHRFASRARRTVDRIELVLAELNYRYSGRSMFELFKV